MSLYISKEGMNESFFKVNKKSKKEKLGWLQNTKDTLLIEGSSRIQEQRNNLIGYLGAETELPTDPRFGASVRNRRFKRFKVPHIQDIVETKVSNLTRLKSDVSCRPAHPNWSDKSAAKVSQYVIRNIFELQKLDLNTINIQRQKMIFGESYLFIEWDKDLGPLHPDYLAALEFNASAVEGEKKIPVSKPVYIGDVAHNVMLPWRVFLQRKETINDVDYCFKVTIVERDKLESQYKNADQISEEFRGALTFNINLLEEEFLENHVAVYEFYHRHTKDLPQGKYIKFAGDQILEESDLPYAHGKLPFCRITDLDVPGYINGVPKFSSGLTVQNRFDDIGTILLKNAYFMSSTKFAVPKGAVDIKQLGNDNTIVEYVGAPPQALNVMSSTPDVYRLRQEILVELQTIMGSQGVNLGNLPSGIRSGTAISLIDERESIRSTSDITKTAEFTIEVARMSLLVAQQYYSPTDQRMLKIVGDDNKYLVRFFDTADLDAPVDIIFENSTGFPESSAARRDRVIEAMQYAGDKVPADRWMDLLDLNSDEKMVKYMTQAIQNADSENEDLLAGRPVKSPEVYEDLITKWESRFALMQTRAFKDESPVDVYNNVCNNMKEIEKLMNLKVQMSPIFSAEVSRLVHYPVFPIDGFVPPVSQEQANAVVQGQANRGDMLTGQIPSGNPTQGGNNGQ